MIDHACADECMYNFLHLFSDACELNSLDQEAPAFLGYIRSGRLRKVHLYLKSTSKTRFAFSHRGDEYVYMVMAGRSLVPLTYLSKYL